MDSLLSLLAEPRLLLSWLTSILVCLVVRQQFRAYSYWSSRGVPGPRPWPFFGTSIYLVVWSRIVMDEYWREKYGRVYGLYEGTRPVLRITDSELIKVIRVEHSSSFNDRDSILIKSPFQRLFLLWSKGSHWHNQRSLITPLFTGARLRKMGRRLFGVVDEFVRARLAHSATGQMVELDRGAQANLLLSMVAQSFYSIKLQSKHKDDGRAEIFVKGAAEMLSVSFGRLCLWLLIPEKLAHLINFNLVPDSRLAYFRQLSQMVLNERRQRASSGEQPTSSSASSDQDVIQMLMDARLNDPATTGGIYSGQDAADTHFEDQASLEELEARHAEQTRAAQKSPSAFRAFSDEELAAHMTFFFLASSDVTSATISYCLYELAHKPHLAELIRQEALPLASASAIDYDSLVGLETLNMFVSEVLRLYSPLLENNRVCTAPDGFVLTLAGGKKLHVAPGQPISMPTFVVHRDPEYWPRPLEFDITRFAPENRHKLRSGAYEPFGLGPRICVGLRLALLMVKLVLVRVVRDYDVKPGPKTSVYPPRFKRNPVFAVPRDTDFKLVRLAAH